MLGYSDEGITRLRNIWSPRSAGSLPQGPPKSKSKVTAFCDFYFFFFCKNTHRISGQMFPAKVRNNRKYFVLRFRVIRSQNYAINAQVVLEKWFPPIMGGVQFSDTCWSSKHEFIRKNRYRKLILLTETIFSIIFLLFWQHSTVWP